VVIANVVDYSDAADAVFTKFSEAGLHLVRTTQPLTCWPGSIPKLIGA
jgi:hypothetical protein